MLAGDVVIHFGISRKVVSKKGTSEGRHGAGTCRLDYQYDDKNH